VNDDVPRRIGGWSTLQSIANPTAYRWFHANLRIAKNYRSKLLARVSAIKSNSLAGNFRFYWSNLCTRT
jgi:hypothetical protein